jgi:mono/diheme cytochrome c family protein
VIGGFVYRRSEVAELYGRYLFGDVQTRTIQALRLNAQGEPVVEDLTTGPSVTDFGLDPRTGEVLMADVWQDTVWRLKRRQAEEEPALPERLSETGLFADARTLEPAAGLVPYAVNVPFWSDYALKRRWFRLPSKDDRFVFKARGAYDHPEGTLWVKHFDMPFGNDQERVMRRLETRVLVSGEKGLFGFTYRWNDEGSDAELVDEEGIDETLSVETEEGIFNRPWRFPSRAECLACHTQVGGGALSFKSSQLSTPHWDSVSNEDNQIARLARAGYVEGVEGMNSKKWTAYAAATDETFSLTHRARSFLTVNCSQCHQPGGPTLGAWDARMSTPLEAAGIINGVVRDPEGEEARRIIRPGHPELSEIYLRLTTGGSRHMPPIATTELNAEGIELIADWINEMKPWELDFTEYVSVHFGEDTDPLEQVPDADPDHDGFSNHAEFVLKRSPVVEDVEPLAWLTRDIGGLVLEVVLLSDRHTWIERNNTLESDGWTVVAESRFPMEEGRMSIPIESQSEKSFYRVQVKAH